MWFSYFFFYLFDFLLFLFVLLIVDVDLDWFWIIILLVSKPNILGLFPVFQPLIERDQELKDQLQCQTFEKSKKFANDESVKEMSEIITNIIRVETQSPIGNIQQINSSKFKLFFSFF